MTPKSHYVLLVEDDSGLRKNMRESLEDEGYGVHEATSGIHAIQIIKTNKKIDFVICDLLLPGTNGFEVLKEVRTQEKLKDVPFFIVTGHVEKETIVKAKQLGVTDYLVKPVQAEKLLEKIKPHLK